MPNDASVRAGANRAARAIVRDLATSAAQADHFRETKLKESSYWRGQADAFRIAAASVQMLITITDPEEGMP